MSITLQLQGTALRIVTTTPMTLRERLLLNAYVPGIRSIDAKKTAAKIVHRQSTKRSYGRKGRVVSIAGAWNEFPDDLYHLLYSMAREQLLKKRLYCVHAACVDINGLVLIAGPSGAGKTTISLELLKRYRIFSGNTTVIRFSKGMRAIAGTPTITVKREDLGTYPGISPLLYGGRGAFSLPEERYAKPGKVRAIYLVRINDGRDELKELDLLGALHTLYPIFLDTAHADCIVHGKELYSADTPVAAKRHLLKHLGKELQETRVYSVSGSVQFITRCIGG
jgi:hypothetical protein